MKHLLPLVHLDSSLQTVAVLSYNAKVSISEVRFIVSRARDMQQLLIVVGLRVVRVTGDAGLLRLVKVRCELDSSLLVLPDQ